MGSWLRWQRCRAAPPASVVQPPPARTCKKDSPCHRYCSWPTSALVGSPQSAPSFLSAASARVWAKSLRNEEISGQVMIPSKAVFEDLNVGKEGDGAADGSEEEE